MPIELKPQPKVNAETSALLDDNEDEDSDDNGTLRKGKKGGADSIVSTIETVKTSPTKQVEKTNAKSPVNLFAPIIIEVKKSSESGMKRPRIVTNK